MIPQIGGSLDSYRLPPAESEEAICLGICPASGAGPNENAPAVALPRVAGRPTTVHTTLGDGISGFG
jgi:hypothetical protein